MDLQTTNTQLDPFTTMEANDELARQGQVLANQANDHTDESTLSLSELASTDEIASAEDNIIENKQEILNILDEESQEEDFIDVDLKSNTGLAANSNTTTQKINNSENNLQESEEEQEAYLNQLLEFGLFDIKDGESAPLQEGLLIYGAIAKHNNVDNFGELPIHEPFIDLDATSQNALLDVVEQGYYDIDGDGVTSLDDGNKIVEHLFEQEDKNTLDQDPFIEDDLNGFVGEKGWATFTTAGGYTIKTDTNKGGDQVIITDDNGKDIVSVWGDPHVDENNDGHDDFHFGDDSTMILDDGTIIRLNSVEDGKGSGIYYTRGLYIEYGDKTLHTGRDLSDKKNSLEKEVVEVKNFDAFTFGKGVGAATFAYSEEANGGEGGFAVLNTETNTWHDVLNEKFRGENSYMENKSFDGQYGDEVAISELASLAISQSSDEFDMSQVATYNYSETTVNKFNNYKASNPELFNAQNSLSNSQEIQLLELLEQNKADNLIAEYHQLLIEQNNLAIDIINYQAQEAQAKYAGKDDEAGEFSIALNSSQANFDTLSSEVTAKYQEVLASET